MNMGLSFFGDRTCVYIRGSVSGDGLAAVVNWWIRCEWSPCLWV